MFIIVHFVACIHTASTIKAGQVSIGLNPEVGALAALPDHSHIAILFRGQAFRKGGRRGRGCSEDHVADQLRITQSTVDKIVLPLERASHIVDVYLAESSGCPLLGRIGDVFGKSRVRMQRSFTYKNQGLSMRRALKEFSSRVPDPAVYRVIMVTRFDIFFKSFIYEWPTVKFNAFNFFSHCEDSPVSCGGKISCIHPEFCVHDIIHVMPGTYFPEFSDMVGSDVCFTHGSSWGGHGCYNQTVRAFGVGNVGFVTDWMPKRQVRENNTEVEWY